MEYESKIEIRLHVRKSLEIIAAERAALQIAKSNCSTQLNEREEQKLLRLPLVMPIIIHSVHSISFFSNSLYE